MARAKKLVATKDIYYHGLDVTKVHKRGKNVGKEYIAIDRFRPSETLTDFVYIAKGETYYQWAFMYQKPQISKTKPRASQLTRNDFMSEYYRIKESVEDLSEGDYSVASDLESTVEGIVSELQNLLDDVEGRLDNMPEGLRDSSPAGEILSSRVDSLQETIDELESIDFDGYEAPDCEDDSDSESYDQEEAFESWLSEKLEEVKGVSFGL